jgi:two-component sensor histidine kinase
MQERQNVMVAELQHRTRNLITVVSALSRQTLKNSTSLNDFGQHFADRLSALSRVQGLLSNLTAGKRVTFDELLGSELKALGAPNDKLTLDGPHGVPLRSATVQTFSLALHELATNALKYGALAAPDGHLTVRWGVTHLDGDGPRLQVDWRESGVMTHVGERPRGGGYGRELIEHALPYQLGAETSYEMTSDGVHCTIDVPASTAKAEVD